MGRYLILRTTGFANAMRGASVIAILAVLAIVASPSLLRAQEELIYAESIFWQLDHPSGQHGYLFGTFHSEDERLDPIVDVLREYIEEVDAMYVEHTWRSFSAHLEENPDSLLFQTSERLQDRIGEDLHDRLDQYLSGYRRSIDRIDYSPTLVIERIIHDPAFRWRTFLDYKLTAVAHRYERPVRSLETIQERLRFALAVEELDAADIITFALEFVAENPGWEDRLLEVYLAQDLELIMEPSGFDCEQTDGSWCETMLAYGDLIERDLLERNRVMASRISTALENETIFVAVGAAHLPAAGGVLEQLVDAGIVVTPLRLSLPRFGIFAVIFAVLGLCLLGIALVKVTDFVRSREKRRRIQLAEADRVNKWHSALDRLSDRK